MSTSARYDTIATRLSAALPDLRSRLCDSLTCALTGMSQAVSAQQRAVAAAMPLTTKQASKIPRFRRLRDTERLTADGVYQPIVHAALTGLRGQRVHVLLDRVVLTETQNVLVVRLGFRRRSVPLVWAILAHSGSRNRTDQQAVLTAAVALLPPAVRVRMQADREFRSQTRFAWVRAQGWDAILGMRGRILVSAAAHQPGQALTSWLPHRDSVAYLHQIWRTDDHHGPVNVLAWWDKNDRNGVTCYAVMTNLPATWQTYRIGSRRMWIATLSRDGQSHRFARGTSAITDPERFHRLIVLVCLVYLWFLSVGRGLVKRGYRTLIDAGASHAWHLSLCTLAVAWQHRLRTFEQPMPVFWLLYC